MHITINKKTISLLLIIVLISGKIFSYELFFSGEELLFFLNQKLNSSKSIKLVSFSLDNTISDGISKINHEIFLEKDGGYSGDIPLSITYDKNYDGYLHQKFIIFDNNSILFGTGNFTKSGLKEDFNIFIYTEDMNIVAVFLKEFSNFRNGKFGNNKKIVKENLRNTDMGNIEIITGPSEEIYKTVLKKVSTAKESIKLFSYSFTDPYFIQKLEKLSSKNICIQIISDDWNKIYNSPLIFMMGIDIKYRNDIHAKCLTIDNEITIIGSYNLTYRAREKNDEVVVIINNRGIADTINAKFDLLWQE
ncbi:hypothetical protein PW5551_09785 [Petrotoga sp. 9PW.55.5.1]|uniref:phospholipase D-like domain-containing protein n=1 Tax=Petrotoga sp. 9PW.55.5.1 TaxID=1308979 RepID=UPI000DC28308|nr:phospholipase D-like domain-containing protein [Petrotoga sp. 9PW.55.5.1]RAO98455.1 hypothetical protein PW5551_09785 [Petrotoga sp. 9PW.55.5.1]